MTREDAREIAAWHYEPPYDFYDASADSADLAELLEPTGWGSDYFAADSDGALAGYFHFKPLDESVEIGLGLRPDLTGRGLGCDFVEAGMAFARDRFSPARFTLAVATFNLRAISVYERAGFTAERQVLRETNGGQFQFVEMSRAEGTLTR